MILNELIKKGFFTEASEIMPEPDELLLFSIGQDDENVSALFYAYYMFSRTNKDSWLDMIETLTDFALPYIEGIQTFQLFVIKEAFDMKPSAKRLFKLLCFGVDDVDEFGIMSSKEKAEYMNIANSYEELADYVKEISGMNFNNEFVEQLDYFQRAMIQTRYDEIEKIFKGKDIESVRDVLIIYAKENAAIDVCAFIQYMIEKTNSKEWIQMQIDVMTQGLECMKEFGIDGVAEYYRKLLECDN